MYDSRLLKSSKAQNIGQGDNTYAIQRFRVERHYIRWCALVCSHCDINLCGWINIEFRINHEPKEDKYYLYSFGKGSIRRLMPDKYGSVESAKNAAYRIYSNEMARIKKAIDYLVAE